MDTIQYLIEKIKKSPLVIILWYLRNKSFPPPHIYKQKVVSEFGNKFGIDILIESGTYKGDMIFGVRNKFKKIISIELSNHFFQKAIERFKKNTHIQIIKGDSGKQITQILKTLKGASVFWLDGHYSGGKTAKSKLNTPIVNELHSILKHKIKSHVILIDDARLFNGKDDYPKISQLKTMLKGSSYHLEVKDDIIRITPKV